MNRANLLALQILVAVVSHRRSGTSSRTYSILRREMLLPPFFFSTPLDVASRVFKWFVEGTIWKHLWITLVEAILAFVIGSLAGVLIGFWFARKPTVNAVFDPYVKMINALPRVVLAPIFALWFGLGIASKVALGFTLVFFIVFFNVYQGVKEVSPTVLANARMLGMSERQLMRHVYWPSALSWMFSSLHTSVGFAVVGAVVGEYLGSAAGLGYIIQQAEGVFDVAGVFAGMFVLAVFVIAIDTGGDHDREAAAGLAAGRLDGCAVAACARADWYVRTKREDFMRTITLALAAALSPRRRPPPTTWSRRSAASMSAAAPRRSPACRPRRSCSRPARRRSRSIRTASSRSSRCTCNT